MQITIDTNNLSDLDIAMLAFLAEQGESPEADDEPEETPAPAKAKKAKATPKVEETPAEEEEDLVGDDGPTLADAIARATQLVSEGEAPKVKTALAKAGAKKVSELKDEDIVQFLADLAE